METSFDMTRLKLSAGFISTKKRTQHQTLYINHNINATLSKIQHPAETRQIHKLIQNHTICQDNPIFTEETSLVIQNDDSQQEEMEGAF